MEAVSYLDYPKQSQKQIFEKGQFWEEVIPKSKSGGGEGGDKDGEKINTREHYQGLVLPGPPKKHTESLPKMST